MADLNGPIYWRRFINILWLIMMTDLLARIFAVDQWKRKSIVQNLAEQ